MVRPIERQDTEKAVELVHALNLTPDFNSGYCPRDRELIEKEIMDSADTGQSLVYETGGELMGVLLSFQAPTGAYDLSGPFVKDKDMGIGEALMEGYMGRVGENAQVNAFFDASSDFYKTLMSRHGFEFRENEYILKLFKNRLKPYEGSMALVKAETKDKPSLISMHREIFGDVYISEAMLVEKTRFKHILMPVKEGKLLGFALLIPRHKDAYLEIFGLLKAHRGKGHAKPFLHALAKKAFTDMGKEQVMLVVDAVNERALKVYRDIGFEIIKRNVSYKHPSSTEPHQISH